MILKVPLNIIKLKEKICLLQDPHFYGEAAMKEIQDSGWVQWKSYNDVFKSNSFYNFCLPQFSLGED